MYHVNSNSTNLKFQWRDIISDYEILLSILSAFTVGTEEYYPKYYPKFYPNSYFYSHKTRKNKYGSYSNLYMHFLYFNFCARNIKNQTGTMIYFHRLSILL